MNHLQFIRMVLPGLLIVAVTLAISSPQLLHRGKRWSQENYPDFHLTFDCHGRPVGFYADVEHHCQIFHLCDADGVRIPHICPNDTAFHQEYRVCDWAYNVDCPNSPNWYYLNDLTYAADTEEPETYF